MLPERDAVARGRTLRVCQTAQGDGAGIGTGDAAQPRLPVERSVCLFGVAVTQTLACYPSDVPLELHEHRPPWKPQRIRTLSADLLNRIFQTNVSDSAIVLFNQRKWLGLETATKLFVDGDDQVDYAHYLKLMWHVLQHEKRNPTFKNDPTSHYLLMFASPTPVKLRQIIRTVVPNSNDEDFFNSLRKTAKEVLVMLYRLRDL